MGTSGMCSSPEREFDEDVTDIAAMELRMLRYAAKDESVTAMEAMLPSQDHLQYVSWRQSNLEDLQRCLKGTLYVDARAGRSP